MPYLASFFAVRAGNILSPAPVADGCVRRSMAPFDLRMFAKSLSTAFLIEPDIFYYGSDLGRLNGYAGSKSNCNEEDFFRYSAGRWLWGEKEQFAARYVEFDIQALCSVAAKSIGSASCSTITKMPEGNFNKSFLVTMTDGREVVAKVPNPNAGRPHFSTASEVATMDYVYTWSSRANETSVGAEHIIMEKAPGIQLSKLWDELQGNKKYGIIQQLVGFEKALATAKLPAYGSLYYSDDLLESTSAIALPVMDVNGSTKSFSIGPTNNRKYFDDGRGTLELDRGPWRSLEQYVTANAQREKISIARINRTPQRQGLFDGPGQYRPSRTTKDKVLDDYQKISAHVLPRDSSTHSPVLWHPDLHTSNIFVDPLEPTRITCIIDWQAVHAAPLFMQVRQPALLDYDGPLPEALASPSLPDNYDTLSPQDQLQARKLRAAQSLYKLYEVELLEQCKSAGRALKNRNTLIYRITALAGSIFTDGEPVLLGYLMKAVEDWKTIAGVDENGQPLLSCPLSYSEHEKQEQKEAEKKWNLGVVLMDNVYEDLGVYNGWNGLVNHADYETMLITLQECKEHFLHHMARTAEEREEWMKAWPFQDREP
ncbi:hypothetical protein EJ08DRAFT_668550 [Tothia fuscella]|uniref:Aminoglycoside phosphotransferase domain-containing protein n=1 Tax=Tothia fuscella TaxID=1048955 RepID=A0A9P4NYB8_9PEZI|nr:hypothetical protein EJ08DRAFT_668550 [Tothia fuscella]